MQVFIAGIMQGSRMDHYIGDQDYRRIISETLLEHRAGVEIMDPNELHPNGVDYDDELAKATLLEMAHLASQVVATPSRLTYTVDRLEARGWVQRRSLASDGRVVVAELTPEGRAALAEAAVGHADLIRRHLLTHLDASETDELAAAMRRVIDSIRDE